ncbi:hypothetical protein AcV7_001014 [Taiwanofungus camphoratus]|nr:hypothetical protein AcV7_001014 [Antrodia cinnamomea]
MENSTQSLYAWVAIVCLLYVVYKRTDPLRLIPAIGHSAPLLSYVGAYQYFRNARVMLQEGYEKYKGSTFKIPLLDQWVVVVNGTKMNEELRKVPDDQMSFLGAAEELAQTKYTIAPLLVAHPIHITVIRGPLTRNLASLLPDVVDEIDFAFKQLIPVQGDEWLSVPALPIMREIVSRASNRIFVGLPICRDPEYIKTAIDFTIDVMKGRTILSIIPRTLKPLVGRFLPWPRRAFDRISVPLKPVVEERLRRLNEHGKDWPDKPNDMLMWLIEEARNVGQSLDLVVQSVLSSNFVSTHTSTISITHALYHLAANPQYLQPLRDEIESIIKEDGWSKLAIGKMWKLDSFMKESQRLNGISGISVIRKAMKDVTLSDGTFIPAGTIVAAAAVPCHHDEENYVNANAFDPFRFSDKRMDENERIKHQYVSTSPEYIAFGHGKHACPGRFFAANELKAVLAHIVIKYDVKFEGEGGRPDNMWLGTSVLPQPSAKVMFRKRQTEKL